MKKKTFTTETQRTQRSTENTLPVRVRPRLSAEGTLAQRPPAGGLQTISFHEMERQSTSSMFVLFALFIASSFLLDPMSAGAASGPMGPETGTGLAVRNNAPTLISPTTTGTMSSSNITVTGTLIATLTGTAAHAIDATTALTSSTSSYATSSGYAVTSSTTSTASFASTAGYSTTSGSTTTASYATTAGAVTNLTISGASSINQALTTSSNPAFTSVTAGSMLLNADTAANLEIYRPSNTPSYSSGINFTFLNAASIKKSFANIYSFLRTATAGAEDGELWFYTMRGGTPTVAATLDKNGLWNPSGGTYGNITGNASTVTGLSFAPGSSLATSGAYSTTLTTTGTTTVTLPTTGTLSTLAGTEELTNKTLNASVGKGTWTASGTWTLPAVTLGGTMSGGGQQLNNIIIGTSTPLAGNFTTLTATGSHVFTQGGNTFATGVNIAQPSTGNRLSTTVSGAAIYWGFSTDSGANYTNILSSTSVGAVTIPGTLSVNSRDITPTASTWTPTVKFGGGNTGITYTQNIGTYETIGDLVFVNMILIFSNKGSSTGLMEIDGLPFNSAATYTTSVNVGYTVGLASNYAPSGYIVGGSSIIYMTKLGTSTSAANLTDADITNTTRFDVSFVYRK